ncbi:MAG: biotin carboxylase N-terminal domain-containing protein, partial [Marinobacter vinifirmus]
MLKPTLKKVLIANRGEIAVRIVRACAEMGIRSVAIYTEPDRYGLHVKRADEAYSLGEDPLAGYLDPARIVNLALETGCDAIHPGYGFLSENARFAQLCEQHGVTFIGPKSDVIHKMGDKTQARDSMRAAGVPITPGSEGNLADLDHALKLANEIGYPVMLKATSGGGGRGIRRCDSPEELKTQYPRVISEATKAFGSAEVFMEKCI